MSPSRTLMPEPGPVVAGPQKILVGGVPVDRLDRRGWTDLLVRDVAERRGSGARAKVVTTANGQVVSLFASDARYRRALLAADHVAADGMSVVNASRLHPASRLSERVATTDWFHDAARAAVEHGLRFYFLGGEERAMGRTAERVAALYPGLQLVGARNGYFDDSEVPRIAEQIGAYKPDVLWIGIGNPRQLLVAHRFADLVPGLTWARTCGGLFDFLSGDRPRAPLALQKAGLEWAYRAANDPRRLLWRYVTTNVHSTFLMAFNSRGPLEPARRNLV